MDQGGKARGQVDAAVVHHLPRQRGPSPTPRAGVQPGQLPPYPDAPGRDRAVVPDHAAGEGRQDRGEGDLARPLPRLPDGGGGGAARAVRPPPRAEREPAPASPAPMLTLEGWDGGPPGVELRPECSSGCRRQAGSQSETPWTLAAEGKAVRSRAQWPENACPQGREGGIQAARRGCLASIWEMSTIMPLTHAASGSIYLLR